MTENNPFARLPEVPAFALTSENLIDLSLSQLSGISGVPGGREASPQLSWSGAPETTKSYTVTVYDPDAPTGSGFWHWAVANIPADTTTIPEGAGDDGSGLPGSAVQIPNDARAARFIGDVGVAADSTPATVGFLMAGHAIARAWIMGTAENPAA